MVHLLVSWLVLSAIIWFTAAILPGVRLRGFGSAILVAAVFGIFNVLIGWLLFAAIGVATLGLGFVLAFLTRWFVNAILLKLVDAVTDRLTISGFGSAFMAAMIMSGLGTLADWALGIW